MFARLKNWLLKPSPEYQARSERWAPLIVPGADGLSELQHLAAARLRANFPAIVVAIAGDTERHIAADVPGTNLTVVVHRDRAEIRGRGETLHGEYFDFDDPQEMLDHLIETVLDPPVA